ncbi:helix-turn-helix transcriptional regulator [Microbacterium sp. HMH0099]|uniref:helix-turn-helix transcriptional regulator n=1 Tax=Microbacterium sp. HMH0099 TaxID=3414026 RepID=UPI003BF6AD66
MDIISELARAIDRADLNRIEALWERHFYRLLLQDPALVDRAMASLPSEWLAEHPRREMWRALTGALGEGRQIPTPVLERFAAFVRHDASARPADGLILLHVRLGELISHGWGERTSALIDEIHLAVEAAEDRAGLTDILPVLFILCAVARMLAHEEPAAVEVLWEAAHWASVGEGHPALASVHAHLALWHVLEERFVEAARLLGDPAPAPAAGTLAHRYQSVGFVVRALIAVGELDPGSARRWIARVDEPTVTGELEWLVLHARSRAALLEKEPWEAIHAIRTTLSTSYDRFPPGSFSGSLLRADLAQLTQIAGDLRSAERVLRAPGMREGNLAIDVSRARQALLRGRPDDALTILRSPMRDGFTPAHFPSGVVLAASAEQEVGGEVREETLDAAAAVVRAHGAPAALTEATPPVRELLLPRVGVEAAVVPQLWECAARVRLTRREQQVLRVLRAHSSLSDIAAALFVSEDTAAASLKALYRKLGAHTREEALWLAGE